MIQQVKYYIRKAKQLPLYRRGRKTGKTDISAQLQKKLDEAEKTGGVVYLPAGLYRLDKPITVPAGVELRGSSSVPVRCQSGCSNGTLIISYYGYIEADDLLDGELFYKIMEPINKLFRLFGMWYMSLNQG